MVGRQIKSGIYKLENVENGKVYIGQSVSIEDRFVYHRWSLTNNRHSNQHLQNAWNKTKGGFSFKVIEYCDIKELDDREMYWINAYSSTDPEHGYNKTMGGDGIRGLVRTREHGENISKSLKGRIGPMKGKHLSSEHRGKISEALRGNTNMHYGKDNAASTPVICIDTGRRFECAADAGRYYGSASVTPGTNIRKCCLGLRPSAYGHKWKYA